MWYGVPDTTDVQWASAQELVNGSLLLKCGFAKGSHARGCQLTLVLSHTGRVRIVVQLHRNNSNPMEVWELYKGPLDWGNQPSLLVSDIEEDGTVATREMEGDIYLLTIMPSIGEESVCVVNLGMFCSTCVSILQQECCPVTL